MSVDFAPLQTHASEWQPSSCRVALNCRLEGRIVPSPHLPDGTRLDAAHVAVLDGFFGEPERLGLLASLTGGDAGALPGPPEALWERNTADGAHASKTWGLREAALQRMAAQPSQAMLEVQTRLAKLYPECIVAHMPSAQMQAAAGGSPKQAADAPGEAAAASAAQQARGGPEGAAGQGQAAGEAAPAADCCNLLANAPVQGDTYAWHVDADPLTLPPCAWRDAFGDFSNREPGLPLLVSLLLYLVGEEWEPDWHAETLFLDSAADVGLVVRPKRYRAVLMDQDVLHRVVAPSLLAGGRPRYSLVWKLAFLPREPGQACSLARPEWGPPSSIGSAARLDAVRRAVAEERKRKRQPGPAPAEQTQRAA